MKICDRCWKLDGRVTKSVTPITIGHEIFDLCLTCNEQVKKVISEKTVDKTIEAKKDNEEPAKPKRKPGRPRKKR